MDAVFSPSYGMVQALAQGMDLPTLFARIESERESLGIDEYSMSQTTLEHVFVALAGGQTHEHAAG